MKTKLQTLLTALLLFVGAANSQCLMTSQYGSATAPAAGSVNFSTCSFFGEYSPLFSAAPIRVPLQMGALLRLRKVRQQVPLLPLAQPHLLGQQL